MRQCAWVNIMIGVMVGVARTLVFIYTQLIYGSCTRSSQIAYIVLLKDEQ